MQKKKNDFTEKRVLLVYLVNHVEIKFLKIVSLNVIYLWCNFDKYLPFYEIHGGSPAPRALRDGWITMIRRAFIKAGISAYFLGYNAEGHQSQSKFHVKHGWFCNLRIESKNFKNF